MSNPNYLDLYIQITNETDPDIKEQLIAELYRFENFLSAEEAGIFAYTLPDYIEDTPGYRDGVYSSYVGIYYSDLGEVSE